LSEQAITAARAADRAESSVAALGKLHGVPVTIKINIMSRDKQTPTASSASRTTSHPATPL
jgi:Asp-tRNA(Asn)/Glu-tRNA(Gln) amidotransferase A subunit family amidase